MTQNFLGALRAPCRSQAPPTCPPETTAAALVLGHWKPQVTGPQPVSAGWSWRMPGEIRLPAVGWGHWGGAMYTMTCNHSEIIREGPPRGVHEPIADGTSHRTAVAKSCDRTRTGVFRNQLRMAPAIGTAVVKSSEMVRRGRVYVCIAGGSSHRSCRGEIMRKGPPRRVFGSIMGGSSHRSSRGEIMREGPPRRAPEYDAAPGATLPNPAAPRRGRPAPPPSAA